MHVAFTKARTNDGTDRAYEHNNESLRGVYGAATDSLLINYDLTNRIIRTYGGAIA